MNRELYNYHFLNMETPMKHVSLRKDQIAHMFPLCLQMLKDDEWMDIAATTLRLQISACV